MSDVIGVTGTSSAYGSSTAQAAANAKVDYDAFLTLLTAQLKNQDPTNPTDSTQYLSQLASFSSVEQQIQTNDKLAQLLQAGQIGQASGLIGKYVTVAGSADGGQVSSVTLTEDGLVANLTNGYSVLVQPGLQISDQPPAAE